MGKVKYVEADNPGGMVACAEYKRQAWVFVKKASASGANLVVAEFSRTDPGAYIINGIATCENEAKIFQCPEKSLVELEKYE